MTDYRARLWRAYIFLVVANLLDMVYTYYGLARGFFSEGNPLLRAHIYTWWRIVLKVVALAGLALGIAVALQMGWRYQRRLLRALRAVTAVYTAMLILHVMVLVRATMGWIAPTGGMFR